MAEDFERSGYCYYRAGNSKKSSEMKAKAPPTPPKRESLQFSLEDVTGSGARTREMHEKIGGDDQEEETVRLHASETSNLGLSPFASSATTGVNLKAESMESFYKVGFIADLTDDEKEIIRIAGYERTFISGQTVLDFNESPEGVYFVLKGSASSYMLGESGDEFVHKINRFGTFGEFWLLADIPPTAKFVADEVLKTFVVPKDRFIEIMHKDGTLARKLYKRFTARLIRDVISTQKYKVNREAS